MQNQNANPEYIYKAMITVWAALLMSQFLLAAMPLFIKPNLLKFDFSKPLVDANAMMIMAFAMLSMVLVGLSFLLKRQFIEQAVIEQKPLLVQTALIVACSLSEAVSLLGLVTAFVYDYQYFFVFSAVGIGAALIHFPRRGDVHAASCKL